jgi:hypothetical protein
MNRAEHLAWCKERAIEYADRGEPSNALTSFISDVHKHPDTAALAPFAMFIGLLYTDGDGATMRTFIEDFE